MVTIDAMTFHCSSGNPRLLAAWLGEIMQLPDWTPATYCTVQAWPDLTGERYDPQRPGYPASFDWITDARYLGRNYPCKSAREAAEALLKAVDEMEAGRA